MESVKMRSQDFSLGFGKDDALYHRGCQAHHRGYSCNAFHKTYFPVATQIHSAVGSQSP